MQHIYILYVSMYVKDPFLIRFLFKVKETLHHELLKLIVDHIRDT